MTDQSIDTTQIWFGGPRGFIGVTYRNVGAGEELLIRAETAQGQWHPQILLWHERQLTKAVNLVHTDSLQVAQ